MKIFHDTTGIQKEDLHKGIQGKVQGGTPSTPVLRSYFYLVSTVSQSSHHLGVNPVTGTTHSVAMSQGRSTTVRPND